MKKSALWKDTFREIWGTKTRFFSIFFIILLGVAFFAGISATGPVMVRTSDKYYDDQDLMDLQVISTLGLSEEDIDLVDSMEEATVESLYTSDVVFEDSGVTSTVFGLDLESDQEINQYVIRDGRLPEESGEVTLDYSTTYQEEYDIGDTIQIEEGTGEEFEDNFSVTEFDVVGFVQSPLYIENANRGNTSVGTGTLDGFSVIVEEDFDLDYRTEMYVRFDESEELEAHSDEYEVFIDNRIDQVENVYEDRPAERLEELRTDIEEEIDEGQAEIDEAREELENAEQDLLDARQDLDEGWAEYEEGLLELENEAEEARSEIASRRQELEDGRNQLEQARQELNEAQAEVDAGWAELEERQQDLDFEALEAELEESRALLEEGEQELDEGQAELDAGWSELEEERSAAEDEIEPIRQQIEEGFSELEEGREELATWQAAVEQSQLEFEENREWLEQSLSPEEIEEIEAMEGELGEQEEEVAEAQTEFEAQEQALISGEEQLTQAEEEIEQEFAAGEAELEQAQTELNVGQEELESNQQELVAGEEQLAQGINEIENAEAELEEAQADIDSGLSILEEQEAELVAGEQQLDEAEAELEEELASAQAELDEGLAELEEGEADYEEGLATFEEEQTEAEEEIQEGEEELAEAEEELDDLEEPEYIINDRSDFAGYSEFGENAERIASIASIFPVFFFLLAVLISLTTMTRMVDEGRSQIGTLKALGYGNVDISLKYFVYAFIATVAGGLIGLGVGFTLFPSVIMDAYSSMYNLPSAQLTFYWSYAVISLIGALLATGLSTLISVRSLLRNNAAELLRPKAPKIGKRIFLEYIPFLWNRFTFTQKVASRNLFRYKRRMLMTIFGVSGCTALLLTGFGLSDSISDISELQFGEINQYEAIVMEDEDASESDLESYEETLADLEEVEDQLDIHQENATIEEGRSQDINLMVPEDVERMNDFVVLRDHEDDDYVHELPEEGAIVTEKLADLYDLSEGETLSFVDSDNQEFEVEVQAIVEHYIDHYVYFSPEAYEELTGESPEFSARMLTYDMDDDAIGEVLTSEEAVQGMIFTSDMQETIQESMDSLDVVTIVLIVSAALLAIVVLYNLTNINVSERIRELSTIKVLGFYNKEVTMYIYRENFVLTLMGIIVGLILGVLMHQFVINTAEVDMMMFSRVIQVPSYLYASLMTFFFSVIVMLIMHKKLKNIDMVEALKTID